MIKKVDVCMLRRGDLVRFVDLELADTWIVKSVENDIINFELNSMFFFKTKTVKINPRRKKYVFVEVA